jgi:predicted RNase H-like HicB family nuclease
MEGLKAMARYLALVDGQGGAFGVRIPDFPGCHGAGATPEDAVNDAISALREFAADMIADGEPIPPPRNDWKEIEAEFKARGEPWGATVLVPLLVDRARPVRANISLDAGLLEEIDQAAAERGLTRSAFLASAARDKIMTGW